MFLQVSWVALWQVSVLTDRDGPDSMPYAIGDSLVKAPNRWQLWMSCRSWGVAAAGSAEGQGAGGNAQWENPVQKESKKVMRLFP